MYDPIKNVYLNEQLYGNEQLPTIYLNFSTDIFPTKQSLQEEFDFIRNIIAKHPTDVVLSHGDVWWPNIIINKQGEYYKSISTWFNLNIGL